MEVYVGSKGSKQFGLLRLVACFMTLSHFSWGRMGSCTIEIEATLAAPSMVDFHPKMPSLLLDISPFLIICTSYA